MPKFLDAPSWYDKTGTLRTLSGTVRFNSVAGYVDLPYTTFASGGADSSYYVLTSTGTSGNIVYSSGACPVYLPNGTSGQVLTSNGNAAPSWKTPKCVHYIRLISGYMTSVYCDISFTFISTRSTSYDSLSQIASDMAEFAKGGEVRSLPGVPAYGMISDSNYSGCGVVGVGIMHEQLAYCAIENIGNTVLYTSIFDTDITDYLTIYDSIIF